MGSPNSVGLGQYQGKRISERFQAFLSPFYRFHVTTFLRWKKKNVLFHELAF
jgi:hypothetical protein